MTNSFQLPLSLRRRLSTFASLFFVPLLFGNFVIGVPVKDAATKKFAVIVDAGSSGKENLWNTFTHKTQTSIQS